ncbi:achromobactin-binding protein, partial [Pseudomonas syringae pv. syringae FF5]
MFQGASDTAVALGVTPCGVVDSWSEKPMYRYLRPALAAVPHVGLETQPSLEDIVLLKPDLIVASRFRHQRIAPLLEQIGTVLMLEEVFEFKRTLAMMGAALQRQQLAMDLLGQWQQ